MAVIFLPLLLILGALVALLLILGRRLPDIRKMLLEQEKTSVSEVESASSRPRTEEDVLSPRTTSLSSPGTVRLARTQKVLAALTPFLLRLFALTRGGFSYVSRFFLHLFSRTPSSIRASKAGVRVQTSEDAAPETFVRTTTDIKKQTDPHPLRFPEPLPSEKVSEEMPTVRIVEPSSTEEPVLESSTSIVSAATSPREESSVVLEQTGNKRLGKRRRVVGRVRQKKALIPPPDVAEAASPLPTPPPPAMEWPEPTIAETPSPVVERPLSLSTVEHSLEWVTSHQTIPALIEEGNYGRAESLLIDVLSKNPRDTHAYLLLGTVYLRRGELVQAKEVFEEALRRDSQHAELYAPLGETYYQLGEYSKALSVFQRAHDLDEANVQYLEKLLLISSRMDRRPLMKVAAKKILALNPQHVDAKKTLEKVVAR